MMNKTKKGQSLVELLFAVAVIILVLGGVIVLMTNVMSSRTKGLDRKKATRLAELVIESMVEAKDNDPETFWQLSPEINKTNSNIEYTGYVYSVGFTNISNDVNYPNCGVGVTDCAEAVIKIDWQGKNPETIFFNRLFVKK